MSCRCHGSRRKSRHEMVVGIAALAACSLRACWLPLSGPGGQRDPAAVHYRRSAARRRDHRAGRGRISRQTFAGAGSSLEPCAVPLSERDGAAASSPPAARAAIRCSPKASVGRTYLSRARRSARSHRRGARGREHRAKRSRRGRDHAAHESAVGHRGERRLSHLPRQENAGIERTQGVRLAAAVRRPRRGGMYFRQAIGYVLWRIGIPI